MAARTCYLTPELAIYSASAAQAFMLSLRPDILHFGPRRSSRRIRGIHHLGEYAVLFSFSPFEQPGSRNLMGASARVLSNPQDAQTLGIIRCPGNLTGCDSEL